MFKDGIDVRNGTVPTLKLTMLVHDISVFDILFLSLAVVMLVNGIKLI